MAEQEGTAWKRSGLSFARDSKEMSVKVASRKGFLLGARTGSIPGASTVRVTWVVAGWRRARTGHRRRRALKHRLGKGVRELSQGAAHAGDQLCRALVGGPHAERMTLHAHGIGPRAPAHGGAGM